MFPQIIGQKSVKTQLEFFVNVWRAGGVIPPTLFSAPKGSGKSHSLIELSRLLKKESGGEKQFYVVNCASIKTVDMLIEQLFLKLCVDKKVTIIFDESHALKEPINAVLLSLFNINNSNRSSYQHNDMIVDLNFKDQTMLFASSKINQMDEALVDRLFKIELEFYSQEEMAEMILINEYNIHHDILMDIASTGRGNARNIIARTRSISQYLIGEKKTLFEKSDWEKLKKIFGIYPLGISPIELKVLEILDSHPEGVTLSKIAAITGLTRSTIQQDTEHYLMKLDFIRVTIAGRKITALGQKYLQDLRGTRHPAEILSA